MLQPYKAFKPTRTNRRTDRLADGWTYTRTDTQADMSRHTCRHRWTRITLETQTHTENTKRHMHISRHTGRPTQRHKRIHTERNIREQTNGYRQKTCLSIDTVNWTRKSEGLQLNLLFKAGRQSPRLPSLKISFRMGTAAICCF